MIEAIGGDQTRLLTGGCFLETTPSGKSYSVIYSAAFEGRRGSRPLVTVEPNHVYVLSDNRDYLIDSRFLGAVAEDRVIGRVAVIWISFTLARTTT
jgi:type IV secretory pathway protease TraF